MNSKYRNKQILISVYIFSLVIACLYRVGDFRFDKLVQEIIASIWIAYGCMHFYINRNNLSFEFKNKVRWMFKMYFVPSLIFYIWTIFLMTIGKVSWGYFSTNLTVFLFTMFAIVSVLLFREKAFKFFFIAVIIAYFSSVTMSIVLEGIHIIPDSIKEAYFNDTSFKNYFEIHDVALSIGYVLVYDFITNHTLTKRRLITVFFAFLIMLIGMKRIAVLAVFVVWIFYKTINKFSEKKKYKICIFSGSVMILFFYLFDYLVIDSNNLWTFFDSLGINTRGRFYYWTSLAGYADFSPLFLGIGRNVSYKLFVGELSYMNVGGAHSDILKMYVENGFVLFGYWLYHYLIKVTKEYKKVFSIKASVIYFVITMYLFLLYLTDNVEIYFVSINFSILIPMCYALREER